MSLDLIPGAPVATVDLGSGVHDPQIRFTAPDSSCIWEGFPVRIRACPFYPIVPVNPADTRQIPLNWNVPVGVGPFTPGEAIWPALQLFDYHRAVLSGYKFQVRVQIFVPPLGGSGQPGVGFNTGGGFSDPSYVSGTYDSGFVDAGGPDCAQAAAFNQAITCGFLWRPFSPLVGTVVRAGHLSGQWVAGSGGVASYEPYQLLAITYGPPAPGYVQSTASGFLDGLAGSGATTPPSSSWSNGIIVGDAGLYANGKSTGSGRGSAWWNATRFASTCEASCTVVDLPTGSDGVWLFARLVDPGTSSVTGYALKVTAANTFTLYRIDAGTLTAIGATTLATPMQRADGYELRCEGDQIIARYSNSDVMQRCYTDKYHDVVAATDSTYRAVEVQANRGYIGLGVEGSAARVVGFVGGSVTDAGLHVWLETNSCGVLTKTYSQVNALLATLHGAGTVPISSTILGGHGADLAGEDVGYMAGADCSGFLNDKGGLPL